METRQVSVVISATHFDYDSMQLPAPCDTIHNSYAGHTKYQSFNNYH